MTAGMNVGPCMGECSDCHLLTWNPTTVGTDCLVCGTGLFVGSIAWWRTDRRPPLVQWVRDAGWVHPASSDFPGCTE